MALYIGTNYHPHDWEEERWQKDIELMKEAGFTTVRLGHLCWDSYEPDEGVYTFEWFDKVMDMFAEAGIGVVLDLAMRPAPTWVHKLCPGCTVSGLEGVSAPQTRRYMDDVSDEGYQYYALRFARIMVRRYRNHPALFAWGMCNEQGSGCYSYTEYSRRRFANWLKKKYGDIDSLNKSWAAQRWSRRLNSFDDVYFPVNHCNIGAPEPWLDMRAYFSDMTCEFLLKLKAVVNEEDPGRPCGCNHYAERADMGFDYLKIMDEFDCYPGIGYYPDYDFNDLTFLMENIYRQRIAESGKPMWNLEFRTGDGNGTVMCGPEGAVRSIGYLSLLQRGQMILGWTWRSMYAAEEKFIFGMLGHDGEPLPNYYEYKKLSEDFKKLEPYAFPYLPRPEIAVAYDYPSMWITLYHTLMFKKPYLDMQTDVTKMMFNKNLEYNIVDLRKLKNHYKLIVIPNMVIVNSEAAETVREYVKNGGTVIMTGSSDYLDENSKVFTAPRPGRLRDVFGIRIAGFARTYEEWRFSEGLRKTEKDGVMYEKLSVKRGESSTVIDAEYYELLELKTAECFAELEGKGIPAVTKNSYGKGTAYYTAAEEDGAMLSWLIDEIADELGLTEPLDVPEGVQARKIADNQYFYVNHSKYEKEVLIPADGRGVLSGKAYSKKLVLAPYSAELLIVPYGAERTA